MAYECRDAAIILRQLKFKKSQSPHTFHYERKKFSNRCLFLKAKEKTKTIHEVLGLWQLSLLLHDIIYPGIQFRLPCTPQDNFSRVPNCSLGLPGWETKVSSKKFWFGRCEIAWFLWQPIANLRRGVCLQNYSYLSCYLS